MHVFFAVDEYQKIYFLNKKKQQSKRYLHTF